MTSMTTASDTAPADGKPRRRLRRRPLADRFWEKVDKNGPTVRPELGPCWIWTGSRQKKGHGHIHLDGRKKEKTNRVSFFLHHGRWPDPDLWVLHSCDNPPCVNPAHLREGTPQDNVDDRDSRNRFVPLRGDLNGSRIHPERVPRGEASGVSKLTSADVLDIRRRFLAGEKNLTLLGKMYGVYRTTVARILSRKSWAHLEDE